MRFLTGGQERALINPTTWKVEFSEVRCSKQPLRRSGKHSTTEWRHLFSVQTLRVGSSCTIVYQEVATRNDATAREILAHRTGTQPNFAYGVLRSSALLCQNSLGWKPLSRRMAKVELETWLNTNKD